MYDVGLALCSMYGFPANTVLSLFALSKHPMLRAYAIAENTLLPQARNTAVEGLSNDNLSHILFIDADMANFVPEHLDRLLEMDKDIIGASCVMRRPPHRLCVNFGLPEARAKYIEEFNKKKSAIIEPVEVLSVGFGFTLVKTSVFQALEEPNCEKKRQWFTVDRMPRSTIEEEFKAKYQEFKGLSKEEACREAMYFGMGAHLGTDLLGEDICFCNRARALGFSVYIDPATIVSHQGDIWFSILDTKVWNRENQLLSLEPEEAEQAC